MLIYFNTEGINYYFLCPFICFFFLVGSSYTAGHTAFGKYTYTQNIIISISEMLAIIPYLISVKMDEETFKESSKRSSINKQDKISNKLKSPTIQLEYTNIEEELSHIKIQQVALLGFVDFLQSFSTFYGNELYNNNYQLYFWSSYIIFLCIFKKYLLKIRVYRHQIVSFFIFFVLDITYTILILTDEKLIYNNYHLIFLILSNICFSFEIVYEKRLIEKTFISIYKLCFFLGLSTFCYNLLISIITTIIKINLDPNNERYKYLFKYSDYLNSIENIYMEILFIFLFIIFNAVSNILQFITIKFLTPNHTLITQLMLALYVTLTNRMMGEIISTYTFIFAIVFHIICFIALLIFLEIIQLNFCDINRDTKLSIGIRSDVDTLDDISGVNTHHEQSMGDKSPERTISMSETSECDNSFD